ncbi:MAG TPA: hypothetical protein VFL66_07720 [Gaiellaceae bacterium]|nr:hypothetical protein [Gaiellaceae bacterium]
MSSFAPPLADWVPLALRDTPVGDPDTPRLLDALLAAIDGQRELLEADVDQVLDDVFVESCADWAVPYIGALVGLPPDAGRLEVAYAIALRRRKGTPAALEDFVRVLTGWTALAVEGRSVTVWAQKLGHPGPPRVSSLDLTAAGRRHGESPFAPWLRSTTPGREWSPRAASALVWPWAVRTYNGSRARPLPNRRYALHPLGLDAPLYVQPPAREIASDSAGAGLAGRTVSATDAPVRATYRVLEELAAPGSVVYGDAWRLPDDHPLATPADEAEPPPLLRLFVGGQPLPWSAIRFAKITPSSPAPPHGIAHVDPLRGHVQLGPGLERGVVAAWHRPVSGSLGALAADARRTIEAQIAIAVDPSQPPSGRRVRRIADAFALAQQIVAQEGLAPSVPGRPDVEIRLETSETIPAGHPYDDAAGALRWRIVAPTLSTPTVRGALHFDLPDAELSLEGFVLGGDLVLGGSLARVTLDGMTMNPAAGRKLLVDPGAWLLALEARRSILGPIRADLAATPISLVDCVVDGVGRSLDACAAGPGPRPAPQAAVALASRFPPALRAEGCTFAGPVAVEAVSGIDSIFVDGVEVADQTDGCLDHCYLGGDSQSLPATFRCLTAPPPAFVSDAFESGGYYAPALESAQPLLTAASDGGEIGAYHHARRAASLARLRSRIHEFVPLGLDSEVVLAPWEER